MIVSPGAFGNGGADILASFSEGSAYPKALFSAQIKYNMDYTPPNATGYPINKYY